MFSNKGYMFSGGFSTEQNSVLSPPGGYISWWKANQTGSTLAENQDVLSWNDLGPDNNDFTAPAVAPKYRLTGGPNSEPAVDFSVGAKPYLLSTFTNKNLATKTVGLLLKLNTADTARYAFAGGTTTAKRMDILSGATTATHVSIHNGTLASPTGVVFTLGVWTYAIAYFASGTDSINVGGITSNVTAGDNIQTDQYILGLPLTLTAHVGSWPGSIAEVIIYDSDKKSELEAYFLQRLV